MIVLDTHVLFWWLSERYEELSEASQAAIGAEKDRGEILISSISAWEIALLVATRRLRLSVDVMTWVDAASRIDRIRFVPVDNAIGVASINLPGDLHRDPADRIITATARHFDAALVTKDQRLRAYPYVRTIW
jgi:PIN domain nuclease of toxin-antitoxin system